MLIPDTLPGHQQPPNINLEKLFRLDSCFDHIAKTEGTLNGHISSTHCHAGRVSQEKNATIYISGIQGLVADPPNLSLSQECLSTFEQELLGQLYNVFLILVNSSMSDFFFNLLPPACNTSVTEVPRSEAELPRGSLHWLRNGSQHHRLGLLGPHWLYCP